MEQIVVTFIKGKKKGYYTQPYKIDRSAMGAMCEEVVRSTKDGQYHFPPERGWGFLDWKYVE